MATSLTQSIPTLQCAQIFGQRPGRCRAVGGGVRECPPRKAVGPRRARGLSLCCPPVLSTWLASCEWVVVVNFSPLPQVLRASSLKLKQRAERGCSQGSGSWLFTKHWKPTSCHQFQTSKLLREHEECCPRSSRPAPQYSGMFFPTVPIVWSKMSLPEKQKSKRREARSHHQRTRDSISSQTNKANASRVCHTPWKHGSSLDHLFWPDAWVCSNYREGGISGVVHE